jgi:polar amino acid transport system permease protein
VSDYLHYLTLPYLWQGAVIAIWVSIGAIVLGVTLGLVLALMRLAPFRVLRAIAGFYIWLVRGTPLLLQLLILYDGLPSIGITLDPIPTAILGLGLNEAAFAAEVIRGGILSVNRSQWLAAHSLGMGAALTMRRIILPQAMRPMLPALGNDTISAVKNTSLVAIISVNELTLRSQTIAAQNFEYFPVFLAAGTIYLLLTTVVALVQAGLEQRVNLERGQGTSIWASTRRRLLGGAPSPDELVPIPALPSADATPSPAAPRVDVSTIISPRVRTASGPLLRISDVTKSYGSRPILRGVSFDVSEGEVLTVMGPSGSGKSTLLRLIQHLEDLDGGRIELDGALIGYDERPDGGLRPVRDVNGARAKARIGMVFQHFNLFDHMTALENVMEAPIRVYKTPRDVAREEARALLRLVGLEHHMDHPPRRLSGGQQQRVAIARALAVHPKLMLFDEPTSALDPELVGEVLRAIRQLAEGGMTMIVVTHEVNFAREVADRVMFMADGVIVEEGPAATVLLSPSQPRTQQFLREVSRNPATF